MGKAILMIAEEVFNSLFQNGELHLRVAGGLPKDARLLIVCFDCAGGKLEFLYESAEFGRSGEGFSLISPVMTKIDASILDLNAPVTSVELIRDSDKWERVAFADEGQLAR